MFLSIHKSIHRSRRFFIFFCNLTETRSCCWLRAETGRDAIVTDVALVNFPAFWVVEEIAESCVHKQAISGSDFQPQTAITTPTPARRSWSLAVLWVNALFIATPSTCRRRSAAAGPRRRKSSRGTWRTDLRTAARTQCWAPNGELTPLHWLSNKPQRHNTPMNE